MHRSWLCVQLASRQAQLLENRIIMLFIANSKSLHLYQGTPYLTALEESARMPAISHLEDLKKVYPS